MYIIQTTLDSMTQTYQVFWRSIQELKYSGTLVYVRFGISPNWYTSCLDAKNFAWYATFVWNTTRLKVKPGEPQPGPTREMRQKREKEKNTRISDS
jgi:hypothetical protein